MELEYHSVHEPVETRSARPGLRCGIVIADEKVISALINMNGIISLSPGSMGPAMATEMIERGVAILAEEIERAHKEAGFGVPAL